MHGRTRSEPDWPRSSPHVKDGGGEGLAMGVASTADAAPPPPPTSHPAHQENLSVPQSDPDLGPLAQIWPPLFPKVPGLASHNTPLPPSFHRYRP